MTFLDRNDLKALNNLEKVHHTHHCEWDYVKIDWKLANGTQDGSPFFCQMVDRDTQYFSQAKGSHSFTLCWLNNACDPWVEDSFQNIKDYDGNDPVDSGYYKVWNTINATAFRVTLKSDKSRQSYGFRLEWQTSDITSQCQKVTCGENEVCDSFSGNSNFEKQFI